MTDKCKISGYEFGWKCGECGNFMGFTGMNYTGGSYEIIIDGEKQYRVNSVSGGQTLECTYCGTEYKLNFDKQ